MGEHCCITLWDSLNSEELEITEKFMKTMFSQYQAEAQILEMQQTQVTQ